MEKIYDGEFQITRAQFDFFMDASREFTEKYVEEIFSGKWKNMETQERHFKFLCDIMFNSEDPELRVNFARSLMFKGFLELNALMFKAAGSFCELMRMGESDD